MIPIPLLLQAYRSGFFPMGDQDRDVHWFSPDPRGIIPLDRFHVPKRLARLGRAGRFEIRVNVAFADVIARCAGRVSDSGNWINREIVETYLELHRLGLAHSVETWQDNVLAGGLYGVALGGAFFGESMFNNVTDASKVALAALVERLQTRHYVLLDVQWITPHLERFGAVEVPRARYLNLLRESLRLECRFDENGPGAAEQPVPR